MNGSKKVMGRFLDKIGRRLVFGTAVVALWANGISPALAIPAIERQRELYSEAQHWLDNKQPERYLKIKKQIASYPLTPYLDYRTFLLDLENKSPQQVNEFISQYHEYPFSGRIEQPYFRSLGESEQWDKLVQFMPSEPNSEANQCYFYTAKWYLGDKSSAISGGSRLWLQGKSVASECDDLFSQMEKEGIFSDELVLQRMDLAYRKRNPSLMKYLAKKLKKNSNQHVANVMARIYASPELVVEYLEKVNKPRVDQSENWHFVELGLVRLSQVDPEKAQSILKQLESDKPSVKEAAFMRKVSEHTALRLMDTEDKKLARWRDGVLKKSSSNYAIEKRIRLAIEQNDWRGIHHWVSLLDKKVADDPEWQYWLGRSEVKLGKKEYGEQRLRKLLGLRNFYSVSAANLLNKPVTYSLDNQEFNPEILHDFSNSLVRIRELLIRDKNVAARSEWYWLLHRSSYEQKAALAQYASDQNWSHFSVVAAIQAKLWGNVKLRFPVAHLQSFKQFASEHQLDPITLLSLARQESALDNMAQSRVGARGLMQLMPQTARNTADKYQLTLSSDEDLYVAKKNIEIGTRYFAELMERYQNNRILALAAYNAGPSRVDRWLEERGGKLDVFQFIESIPFTETRNYVQNILMFETYYRVLLGVKRPFLKQIEINSKY